MMAKEQERPKPRRTKGTVKKATKKERSADKILESEGQT